MNSRMVDAEHGQAPKQVNGAHTDAGAPESKACPTAAPSARVMHLDQQIRMC
jgi:hypothetical protein